MLAHEPGAIILGPSQYKLPPKSLLMIFALADSYLSTSTSYVGAITLDYYATGGARSRERYEMIG